MESLNYTKVTNLTDIVEQDTRTRFPARLQNIIDDLKEECLRRHQRMPFSIKEGLYCNRTVDAFGGCWPDTPAGNIAVSLCPAFPQFNTKAYAYRTCTINGSWFVNSTTGRQWANYSACFSPQTDEEHRKIIYIFVGGFSLSLLMLILSLCIFFRFKQLRCDRITIHKNLFVSYVFTGVSWLLYYLTVALDGNIQLENPGWCQVLHVVTQYFTVSNFLWMFCEGLYLNSIMVYAFSTEKALILTCYIIGWLVPLLLACVYAGVRSSIQSETLDCWINETSLQWIMFGPVVLSIAINVAFLVNIVRLLITKLRQMPEASQTRKAIRATLILVPLLGLQYLLLPIRPEAGSPLEEAYHVAAALVASLQGAFVSLMYCFLNGEVLSVMRRKWKQHRLMKGDSIRLTMQGASTTYTTADSVCQPGPAIQPGQCLLYSSFNKRTENELEMKKLGSKC
ncbi:hypothetical protein CHS0354_014528 [Potamilus streckersoni]|uniref:Uncharacterized protein n=1 Tax=Potamilus streckersoni TaxID=2493646 RepID=A0AAE0VS38_9BIVA|nr:hypothetical protein CHS0354_014528 [Potamilus streckersoni]